MSGRLVGFLFVVMSCLWPPLSGEVMGLNCQYQCNVSLINHQPVSHSSLVEGNERRKEGGRERERERQLKSVEGECVRVGVSVSERALGIMRERESQRESQREREREREREIVLVKMR